MIDLDSMWKELEPSRELYFSTMEAIEQEWTECYRSKDFSPTNAVILKELCLENIEIYKARSAIQRKYGETPILECPGAKRLAMLYEKQGNLEAAIAVCEDMVALNLSVSDAPKRLERLKKKLEKQKGTAPA